MITRFFTSLLAACLSLSGCSHQDGTVPKDIVITEKSLQLIHSDNTFGFRLFAALPEDHTHNVMVSPLSVSLALSMALNGAGGETLTAMKNTLGFESLTPEEINRIYLDLVTALKQADNKVVLNIANSIWIRKGFPVLNNFIETNQKYFDASIENLEFNTSAIKIINDWVNAKTSGKIPTILNAISAQEIMFLINAIYFNGKWQIQFDPSKTTNTGFTLYGGEVKSVPMMKVKEDFAFSRQSNYSALKMPYGRGKFSMVIILPDEGTTPDAVAKLMDRTKWESLVTTLNNPVQVDVWLPRFEYSWEKELNDMLSSLGMAVAFSPDNADFSGINADYQIFITKVKHKTYIKVNEEGTEAAAVTSVGFGVTSFPANPEFHVNRPFLYAITESDTGAILFIGKVENPLLKE